MDSLYRVFGLIDRGTTVIHVLANDGKPRAWTVAYGDGVYSIGAAAPGLSSQEALNAIKQQLGVKESSVIAVWATVLNDDDEHTIFRWYAREFWIIDRIDPHWSPVKRIKREYEGMYTHPDARLAMERAVMEYRAEMERQADEVYSRRLRCERVVKFIKTRPERKALRRWRWFVNVPGMLGCKNRLLREFHELRQQLSETLSQRQPASASDRS